MQRSNRVLMAAVAVGLAAAGIAAGSAALAGAHATPRKAVHLTASGAWTTHFPLLREELSGALAPANLGTKVRSHVASAADSSFGRALRLKTGDAQVVSGPSGWQLTVVPGSNGSCVVAYFPATSSSPVDGGAHVTECDTSQDMMQYGLVATGFNDGKYYVAGLVPSGNSSVTVHTTNGSQTVPVSSSGTVMSNFDDPVESMGFVAGTGTSTTTHYDSSGAPSSRKGSVR